MELKNFLLPLSLALLTTWAIQYFIINRYVGGNENGGEVRSGQTFVAPQNQIEAQPLNKEVNFVPQELADTAPAIETSIDTPEARYLFSNKGACLQGLTFNRMMNGQRVALPTLEASQELAHENRCFLVALDQNTPYRYTLVEQKPLETATQLVYRSQTGQIEKIFTVYHTKFQIDLTVRVTPKNAQEHVRIFYGAPSMPTIKDDVISAVYNSATGSIKKEPRGKLDLNKGWFLPTLFGSDNRYFVHALVADQQRFAQRAYYSLTGKTGLISILETGTVTQPMEWTLSFYFGPKEDEAMNQVDPRLEQTLDYSGWLAPLSRLLLMILKYLYSFLHNYGWAIVVMTILINLILLPLNIKGAQGMKKYSDFQKKLAYVQQRYKDDPDVLARERAELLSKNGIPGIGGCLPKLLQLPIFFALSRVLSSSIELYKAPFILWIHDLSAADPYYILPLLIMLSMMFLSPTPDPKQRFMMIAIALVFGVVSAKFSAGLCLYIFVGIVLTGVQTLIQQKMNWA